ncbi:hypothetical protein BS78_04G050000 [Paspalum vaginatum]|nr:hypothetical protein BS78_04G050000 [Paspalum vaginatum]
MITLLRCEMNAICCSSCSKITTAEVNDNCLLINRDMARCGYKHPRERLLIGHDKPQFLFFIAKLYSEDANDASLIYSV